MALAEIAILTQGKVTIATIQPLYLLLRMVNIGIKMALISLSRWFGKHMPLSIAGTVTLKRVCIDNTRIKQAQLKTTISILSLS